MVWIKDRYGFAMQIDLPVQEIDRRCSEQGERFYATLGGLILNEGVVASALTPVSAVPLYDGIAALRRGGTSGMDPVEIVSGYAAEVLNGQALDRKISSERLLEAHRAAELAATGRCRHHVVVIDMPEFGVRLAFKSPDRQKAETLAADAVRAIFPDELSLYTAVDNNQMRLIRGHATGRPEDHLLSMVGPLDGAAPLFLASRYQDLEDMADAPIEAMTVLDLCMTKHDISRAITAAREKNKFTEICP